MREEVASSYIEGSNLTLDGMERVLKDALPRRAKVNFIRYADDFIVTADSKELLEANWYRYDDLPLLPPPGTVARRLIEDTVAMCRAEYE